MTQISGRIAGRISIVCEGDTAFRETLDALLEGKLRVTADPQARVVSLSLGEDSRFDEDSTDLARFISVLDTLKRVGGIVPSSA